MEFLDDIKQHFRKDLELLKYKLYIMGGSAVLVIGVKNIYQMSDSNIVVRIGEDTLAISGLNLHINNFADAELLIEGKIKKVEIL